MQIENRPPADRFDSLPSGTPFLRSPPSLDRLLLRIDDRLGNFTVNAVCLLDGGMLFVPDDELVYALHARWWR